MSSGIGAAIDAGKWGTDMTCGAIGPLVDCPECHMPVTNGRTGGHKTNCSRHPRQRVALSTRQERDDDDRD